MSVPIKRNCVEYLDTLTLSQWKDKYNAYGFLKSVFANFQPIEDTLFDILDKRSLVASEGVQLDVIGSLFNIKRANRGDESYRQAIYEKISQQAYGVTIPNIVDVLRTASSATKVEVYEHPYGNTHIYLDVGPQENLFNIGSSITAAGIGCNVMFPPLDDKRDGENSGLAFHHNSNSNLIESPYRLDGVGWNTNQATVLNDVTTAPNPTFLADSITDDNTSQAEFIEASVAINGNNEFDVGVFIKKDTSTTNDCLLFIEVSGVDASKYYGIQVAIDDGTHTTAGAPISYYVEDCVDYWFVTLRGVAANHSSIKFNLYPSASVDLGPLDATLTGSLVAWGASIYVDAGQYNTQVSKSVFRPPMIIREEYLVVDDVLDFVVDENLNNILAISEGINNPYNSKPLSIYHNIFNSQPISVVV